MEINNNNYGNNDSYNNNSSNNNNMKLVSLSVTWNEMWSLYWKFGLLTTDTVQKKVSVDRTYNEYKALKY